MTGTGEGFAARHDAVRARCGEFELEALVVSHLPNVRYLTGFDGSSALAVLRADSIVLVTDGRYRTAVEEALAGAAACAGLRLELASGTYEDALARALGGLTGRVAFEAAHTTVAALARYRDRLGSTPDLIPSEGLVESSRLVKEPSEAVVLREAAARISAVAEGVLADLRPGLQERDVARAIEAGMWRMGFVRPAFDTIVASGPNSALPHARAGDRVLAPGDLVVLDFGGVYQGYCVDLTRMASLGPPGPDARGLFDAVHAAHRAAVETVRPGQSTRAIDQAARDTLIARGYGDRFVHGTGHGLGLEVHEAPRIGPPRAAVAASTIAACVAEPERVSPGMVFTIEPGAYVPGFGGVRIEDDVLVTAEGCEVLTTVDRSLRVC